MELAVTDLACARGGLPILSGLSFRLGIGQLMLLRGPNGAGKTTLLRTLAGLQSPLAGTISVPPEAVAYAAHADAVKPTLTVDENLAFWAAIYGAEDIRRAREAFALDDLREQQAQHLSAGQKRRLGLARLLLVARPVWALDEPTVSLDARAVGLFVEALRRHLDAGGSALIATHIDLGIMAPELDLIRYRVAPSRAIAFDEAFA
ncbi:heme ABC exporter ATP-binding protein CcmA [Roseitranquillus sediminis]|uniref:heme ABC exporter ATP-binding protein CcmA n=1 Tax=Roseitranquillus sediminis TaxID=2809051 RepID=UPI001D0C6C1B|nr:heme ABC exporter ATP-binding protein CcmA [Roseitranquillus sediminis]MBM9594924.1 heme ABC exporter ATP-binding protein CcmA [Roseitranquillus sediminis]